MKDVEKLEKLKEMMKDHDWFYSFSDDGNVWERGTKEREELMKYIRKLLMVVNDIDELKKVVMENTPEMMQGGMKELFPTKEAEKAEKVILDKEVFIEQDCSNLKTTPVLENDNIVFQDMSHRGSMVKRKNRS